MSEERKIHELAKEPHRRWRTKDGLPPSDAAIAEAFWGHSHCQFHDAKDCSLVEKIIDDAEAIDRGEPSWFQAEETRLENK